MQLVAKAQFQLGTFGGGVEMGIYYKGVKNSGNNNTVCFNRCFVAARMPATAILVFFKNIFLLTYIIIMYFIGYFIFVSIFFYMVYIQIKFGVLVGHSCS